MAAFDLEALTTHPLDYRLSGGPVLFWSLEVLQESTEWLSAHGYDVVTLPVSDWGDASRMHDDVSRALNFPSYYGRNLDALNDCMSDVAVGDYGSSPSATGLVLALTGFDRFVRDDRATAHTVLEIVTGQARVAMSFGRRFLFLIQSDDPDITLDPVGAVHVGWNGREWLTVARHP
ncbi:barstar family protein [Demequina sp.]|uniref:barstar family protein n=1 Tax=Demequina sp. TaxID=2050685 RepID=UPI0025C3B34C|nr:barstar family protein [Demequina sp.]